MAVAQITQQRFTTDGSATMEERLAEWCAGFAEDVRKLIPEGVLEAIVLGGGYGRGEGGVLRTDEGDFPYNDLEFYIFVRGPLLLRERQYRGSPAEVTHRWSEKTGIEFEAKILTFTKIQRSPVTMFYHDLVMGHRWIYGGGQEFADCEHQRAAHRIPMHEATRLLMNRSSGLLFSAALLEADNFSTKDSDFVRRNIAKAQLALGDVVLTAFGRYHSSCRERHRRLEKLEPMVSAPWLSELLAHHQTGVLFKLHPFASNEPQDALAREHAQVTELAGRIFLWLEERRLGMAFDSHRHYAFHQISKQPETARARNVLINLRTFGPRVISNRYPRERLLESLALLLWTPEALDDDLSVQKIQRDLATRSTTFEGLVDAYRKLWCRFN
jgi:hypothetical protein